MDAAVKAFDLEICRSSGRSCTRDLDDRASAAPAGAARRHRGGQDADDAGGGADLRLLPRGPRRPRRRAHGDDGSQVRVAERGAAGAPPRRRHDPAAELHRSRPRPRPGLQRYEYGIGLSIVLDGARRHLLRTQDRVSRCNRMPPSASATSTRCRPRKRARAPSSTPPPTASSASTSEGRIESFNTRRGTAVRRGRPDEAIGRDIRSMIPALMTAYPWAGGGSVTVPHPCPWAPIERRTGRAAARRRDVSAGTLRQRRRPARAHLHRDRPRHRRSPPGGGSAWTSPRRRRPPTGPSRSSSPT